jgi:hypothetical protein
MGIAGQFCGADLKPSPDHGSLERYISVAISRLEGVETNGKGLVAPMTPFARRVWRGIRERWKAMNAAIDQMAEYEQVEAQRGRQAEQERMERFRRAFGAEAPERTATPGEYVLAFLNLFNAALPAWVALELFGSPQKLENEWGIFVALAVAGAIGLGICLSCYPSQARKAAVVAILLIALHAVMATLIAFRAQSLGSGLVIMVGLGGSAVFGIIPIFTLVLLISAPNRPSKLPGPSMQAGGSTEPDAKPLDSASDS